MTSKHTHIYSEDNPERAACGAPLTLVGNGWLVFALNIAQEPTCFRCKNKLTKNKEEQVKLQERYKSWQ